MPISHKYKCIFVHIPKCAGTSMEFALGMHGANQEVGLKKGTNVIDYEHLFGGGMNHFTIRQIKKYVDNSIYEDYFKFAFVRNPWDRLVSHIAWRPEVGGTHRWLIGKEPGVEEVELIVEELKCQLSRRDVIPSFVRMYWREFFDSSIHMIKLERLLLKNLGIHPHLRPQWEYVYGESMELEIDFLGFFEHLERDWATVCDRIGCNVELPSRMVSNHADYESYFNDGLRRAVGNIYKHDVELFGYKF